MGGGVKRIGRSRVVGKMGKMRRNSGKRKEGNCAGYCNGRR
jgi:hypothetical protein